MTGRGSFYQPRSLESAGDGLPSDLLFAPEENPARLWRVEDYLGAVAYQKGSWWHGVQSSLAELRSFICLQI
jgi:hypothetical protein